jgi:hypothetical protein
MTIGRMAALSQVHDLKNDFTVVPFHGGSDAHMAGQRFSYWDAMGSNNSRRFQRPSPLITAPAKESISTGKCS